ncbi:hypothetical protein G7Y89_g15831 [Cudoniella acicularis]|uniref:Uncharacterized protein n=1 Tax=Cudoniella acicularis TaxID=354080 RepID=A0A8H4QET7_9HELO|nr:hypothetical protein G7Y89_g15831 [Cudoniella acicularis]
MRFKELHKVSSKHSPPMVAPFLYSEREIESNERMSITRESEALDRFHVLWPSPRTEMGTFGVKEVQNLITWVIYWGFMGSVMQRGPIRSLDNLKVLNGGEPNFRDSSIMPSLLLSLAAATLASTVSAIATGGDFNVLAFNVAGLPAILNSNDVPGDKATNAGTIGTLFAEYDYDVIHVQEVGYLF